MIGNDVAIYVRVSTADQDLAGQERELRAYAASRGWRVSKVYAEKASATGKVARDQYEQLLVDSTMPTRRGFSRVVVWSLDRWSREPTFSKVVAAIERLEVCGVAFHSLKEPMLDSTPEGTANFGRDLLRAILPVIASFEAQRRTERTRVAMREISEGRRKTRSGRPVGRPRRVDAEKEATIRRLRYETEPPTPWRDIAVAVHLPASTCRKVRPEPVSEIPHVVKGPGEFRTRDGGSPRERGAA